MIGGILGAFGSIMFMFIVAFYFLDTINTTMTQTLILAYSKLSGGVPMSAVVIITICFLLGAFIGFKRSSSMILRN